MSRDNDNRQAPLARLPGAHPGSGMFPVRSCYGATGSGTSPLIVRSRRGVGGRVRHAVVRSAETAGWQKWLLDNARSDVLIVGCVTVQESLTLWLQAPFASLAKAEKVLPSLLDVQLPFPLESCYYRFADIRRMPDGATHALAVAARIEDIKARLDICRNQGLNPVLLDHEGLALWTQSRDEIPLPPDTRRVILHVDRDHVTLVIGQGACYGNAHSVRADLPAVATLQALQAGLPPEGSDCQTELTGLIGRLQRILRAGIQPAAAIYPASPEGPVVSPGEGRPSWFHRASREYPVPQSGALHWLACGIGARNQSLIAGLHQALAGEWPGPLTIHREPESFLARALGSRALNRGPLRCNLRIHELAHPALLRRIRKRRLTTAALFLAAGLFLCGINLTWRLLAAQREAGLKQAIANLAAGLAPGAKIPYGQEIREAKKIAAERVEREAPFLDAFEPSLAGRLADLIRAGKEQGAAYETLTLQRNGFTLAGAGDDWDQCARLAGRLQALGYSVRLERQEAVADAQVRFAVKGEKPTPTPSQEGNKNKTPLLGGAGGG